MKICINVKAWQRPKVLDSTLRSIRNAEANSEHEVLIHVAVSEDDPHAVAVMQACDKHRTEVRFIANRPLSTKANVLSKWSSFFDYDFWMVLGSDDIVSPNFFDAYDWRQECWGWSYLYLYEPTLAQFVYWPGYDPKRRNESIGAGRALSRSIMERLNFMPYADGLDRNLDRSLTQRLADFGVTMPHSKLPDGVYLVDCKDEVSVTPMEAFPQEVLEARQIPECLKEYLLCL